MRNIQQFASLSRGGTDWTDAFRTAMHALAAEGGGTLQVPAGEYLTGPIVLLDHITLHLASGSTLRFFSDEAHRQTVHLMDRGRPSEVYHPLLFSQNACDVHITGQGCIDGQGKEWWSAFQAGSLSLARPHLIWMENCEHISVEGVTLINSPAWTVHPRMCRDVLISHVTIHNPYDAPNTDGINPDSCEDVRILDCLVDVGDDCVTLKSGTVMDASLQPTRNVHIARCQFLHGHGGIVIGSETSNDILDVTVSDCQFSHTDRGIRLKTRRGRGGTVKNIHIQNTQMDHVMCPIVMNMFYMCGPDGKTESIRDKSLRSVTSLTPVLQDVFISSLTATHCGACAGFFYGLPESPIASVTLSNVSLSMDPDAPADTPAMMENCPLMRQEGFYLRNVQGLALSNISLENCTGPAYNTDHSVQFSSGRL